MYLSSRACKSSYFRNTIPLLARQGLLLVQPEVAAYDILSLSSA